MIQTEWLKARDYLNGLGFPPPALDPVTNFDEWHTTTREWGQTTFSAAHEAYVAVHKSWERAADLHRAALNARNPNKTLIAQYEREKVAANIIRLEGMTVLLRARAVEEITRYLTALAGHEGSPDAGFFRQRLLDAYSWSSKVNT